MHAHREVNKYTVVLSLVGKELQIFLLINFPYFPNRHIFCNHRQYLNTQYFYSLISNINTFKIKAKFVQFEKKKNLFSLKYDKKLGKPFIYLDN